MNHRVKVGAGRADLIVMHGQMRIELAGQSSKQTARRRVQLSCRAAFIHDHTAEVRRRVLRLISRKRRPEPVTRNDLPANSGTGRGSSIVSAIGNLRRSSIGQPIKTEILPARLL